MNKKNITLMVVAIATLITFVGLATYAYFVGNINTTRTSNVTATTEINNLVFDTNGGAMQLNVSASNMQRAKNGTVAAQNNTTLTVNLTANTDYSMVCTYDIIYEWTSTDKYTAHSSGVSSNEFTIKASLASNSNTYEGTNNIANETDLSSLTYTNNSATVVSGAQIDATGTTRSTAVWTLESKIYNVNANQTNLVNKNFSGRFKIANVSCVAGNVTATGPSLISFTIDGESYQAEEGMTWAEWVNSPYNINSKYSLIQDIDGDPVELGYNVSASISSWCSCKSVGVTCLNGGNVNIVVFESGGDRFLTNGSCAFLNKGPSNSSTYEIITDKWSFAS